MLYPHTPAVNSHAGIMRLVGLSRVNIEGIIDETPNQANNRTRLHIKVTSVHEKNNYVAVNGRIMLSIKEAHTQFRYGDRVRFFGALKEPRNFQNPGGFDYVRYLVYRDITATSFLPDDRGIIVLRRGEGNRFLQFIEVLRDRIRAFLEEQVPSPSRDIIKALVIGEQDTISDQIKREFSRLGLSHLLSISGLHVSIFALLSYLLLMWLFRIYPRVLLYINAFKLSVFLSIFPVLFYCFIAGFNIPTMRSAIMVMCYLVALLLGRREDLLHTLFVAAFITLLLMPASLFDLSFQLSFSAVLAIVVLVPQWKSLIPQKETDPFENKNPVLEKCRQIFCDSFLASAAAILGTAPLVAVSFHYFSFLGFFSNIIITPLVTFIIVPLALLAALMLFLSPWISALLFSAAGLLTDICLNCTALWAQMPGAEIKLASPALWEIAVFYLLVVGFSFSWKTKLRGYVLAATVGFMLLAGGLSLYAQTGTGTLRVTFLDVGAGDAALIEFPRSQTMLIDGGGFMDESMDMGETVIAPFLYHKGIKHVDYLVLSHPHKDHAGGLAYIAESFRVKELWLNGETGYFESYNRLMRAAREKGIEKTACSSKTPPRDIDGVRIDFLSPDSISTKSSISDQSDTNNSSLVMKLTFGTIKYLFCADILQNTEHRLTVKKTPVDATIIKAPHHGGISSNTEEFVQTVSPEVAVFSCRSYGTLTLPHPDVIARYRKAGATIYRTDRDGAISIETDGKKYQIVADNN
jgi:competence protein ComEC